MIRFLCAILALILLLTVAVFGIPNPDNVFIVDGKKVDVTYPLEFRPGDVLIWVGDLVRFGWVSIDTQEKTKLILRREAATLVFHKGKAEATINGLTISSDTAPETISGRFFVPLAFTCRALGFDYGVRNALVIESNTRQNTTNAAVGKNSICGKVFYNGHPIAGIKVRAVTEQNAFVPQALAVSDEHGAYSLRDLPDGSFRPYIYVADNPEFFNRNGELVSLTGANQANVATIHLGRLITPLSPSPGAQVIPEGAKIKLSWSECPEAVRYRMTVEEMSSCKIVCDQTVPECRADVPVRLLTAGKTYLWSITAKGAGGKTIGGSPASGRTPWTFKLKRDRS